MLWLQKSRVSWLTCGDRNTKFIHTPTIIRQKYNKIEGLLNENHQWEYDVVLKDVAMGFYKSLYKADPTSGGGFIRGCFP